VLRQAARLFRLVRMPSPGGAISMKARLHRSELLGVRMRTACISRDEAASINVYPFVESPDPKVAKDGPSDCLPFRTHRYEFSLTPP